MNEFAATLIEGLLDVEKEVGATLNWAGTDYPCSHAAVQGNKSLTEGGFRVTAQVTLNVRTVLFPEGVGWPSEKKLISFKNSPDATPKPLRIDGVTPVYNEILVLECNATGQGL